MAQQFLSTESTDWVRAYIALGSNIGSREAMLGEALSRMDAHPDIAVSKVSAVYETDPVGYADQPAFLNMAAAVSTRLTPVELLRELLAIELALGRVRDIRNGPRTIDLDVLYMDDAELDTEELILPHPRMMERAFVLVPLREVLDDAMPIRQAVEAAAEEALLEGKEGITRWTTINWRSASAHSGS
jgi:2-amino-4-hydroxy-6-hydroxymethyldihydropteridine diphosphokinase